MILLANGCSWTWGGGLEPYVQVGKKRDQLVWPYHLGNLLSATQTVNLAKGCGSNQRIVRTTRDWIMSQNEETLSNTIAVIQWTEPSRYEFYHDPSGEYDPNKWMLCKIDCVSRDIELDKETIQYHEKLNSQRYITYTDIEGMYRLLEHYESLDNIFKNNI